MLGTFNDPILDERSSKNELLNFILTLIACVSTVAWIWVTLFEFSSVLSFVFALFGFWIVLGFFIYILDEMFCGVDEQIRRGKVREEVRLNQQLANEEYEKFRAEAEAKEILRQQNEEENIELMNEALKFYLANKKGE